MGEIMSPDEIKSASPEDLADRYGKLNADAASIKDEQDLLKEEFGRRGLQNGQRGKQFIVSISETTSTRLDTKAMRADPKIAKLLPKFEKTSTSISFRVKPVPPSYEA